jgi:hypothetical protein
MKSTRFERLTAIAFSTNSGYTIRTEYCGYRAAARRLARVALPSWSYAK